MFTYKSKIYGRKNKKVVFLLSGWGFDRRFFSPVAFALVLAGYQCIVYSYDASILSPNIKNTKARFELVKKEILSRVELCKYHGDEPYAIFGTSLGALLTLMVVNETPEFKKIVLNLTGSDIAEIIWSWEIFRPAFKKILQTTGITIEQLKEDWKAISPINNISNLNHRDILIYLSERDQVIPYNQGRKFLEDLKKRNYKFTLVINKKLRHVSAAAYNLINFPIYIKFLRTSK
ncbi:MAG: prolyl oligopeptidase family serine peptidase [bacterium]|nr:prolyl oligopeptidase family serine peptidase [bacterium]